MPFKECECQFRHNSSSMRGELGGGVRVRVVEDSATHTLDQWKAGQEWGVASVAIETGGQWCWILLLGRRGRLPLNEMRGCGVVC